jgi:hypothetical protein
MTNKGTANKTRKKIEAAFNRAMYSVFLMLYRVHTSWEIGMDTGSSS